jgi:hypothetical protein
VRAFCVTLLKSDYEGELRSLTLRRIRSLLGSQHDEVQAFAAELLKGARGVENLAIGDWLELLRIENPLAIPLLCALAPRLVAPERLTLAQCVELACARPAPVAELGLRWAKTKPVSSTCACGSTRRPGAARGIRSRGSTAPSPSAGDGPVPCSSGGSA